MMKLWVIDNAELVALQAHDIKLALGRKENLLSVRTSKFPKRRWM